MLTPTRPSDIDYGELGFWEDRTLSSFLDEAASSRPDAVAIHTGTGSISYATLRHGVATLAASIAPRWMCRHDVATVLLPNWPEAAQVIHAVSWVGGVVCPVVTTYRQAEMSFILGQSRPKVVFIPHVFRGFDYVAMFSEILAGIADPPIVIVVRPQGELPPGFHPFDELVTNSEAVARVGDPADISMLLYTSGTTSQAKGVLHSHQTIVWEMRSIIRELELGADDRTFMASPVGHLTGIVYGVFLPTLLTQSLSLLDTWDSAAAVDIIERDRCTFSLGATPFLSGLIAEYTRRSIPSSLRMFICGGADIPAGLISRGADTLVANVTRTYGSSEMPVYSISGPSASRQAWSETDGTPVPPGQGYLINVRDGVGELVVRGPELFLGYLDPALNESAFTPDGFFKTGDLVELHSSGALTVRGRVKDIIIRGGENISALEIEDSLRRHADIDDAAVVGYADPTMGERVAAFLVLRSGAGHLPPDVGAFLTSCGLAAHKRPEWVEVVADLPRTASGKVQKQILRQRLADAAV